MSQITVYCFFLTNNSIAGFGFAFSQQSLAWEDLVKRPNVTVSCRYNEGTEAPFRFQVFAKYDSNDPITR